MQPIGPLEHLLIKTPDILATSLIGAISASAFASLRIVFLPTRLTGVVGAECILLYKILQLAKEIFSPLTTKYFTNHNFPYPVKIISSSLLKTAELSAATCAALLIHQQHISLTLLFSIVGVIGGTLLFCKFAVWSIKKSFIFIQMERLPREIQSLQEQKTTLDIELHHFQEEFSRFEDESIPLRQELASLANEREAYLLDLKQTFSRTRLENDELVKEWDEDIMEEIIQAEENSEQIEYQAAKERQEVLNQLKNVIQQLRKTWDRFLMIQSQEKERISLQLPVIESIYRKLMLQQLSLLKELDFQRSSTQKENIQQIEEQKVYLKHIVDVETDNLTKMQGKKLLLLTEILEKNFHFGRAVWNVIEKYDGSLN